MLLHDCDHDLGRPLCVHFIFICDAVRANHTHPLEVRVKLETTINNTAVSPPTFEAKDHLGVNVGLVQGVPSKLKHFNFHRVSN